MEGPDRSKEKGNKALDDGKGARTKVRGTWWRTTDEELVSSRVDDLKRAVRRTERSTAEEDLEKAFDEASRDPMYRNLLDMVPVRTRAYRREGKYLMVPVYRSKRGDRIASLLHLRRERRVRMDSYGWTVWELCDGRRDIGSIGDGLARRYGDRIAPLYPRLSKFLAYLVHLELISLQERRKRRKITP